jgi:hypothetical protein
MIDREGDLVAIYSFADELICHCGYVPLCDFNFAKRREAILKLFETDGRSTALYDSIARVIKYLFFHLTLLQSFLSFIMYKS